ncbi:MAG: peptidylprolyl isomerase [Gammaproteobacteria bacterium]
MLQSMHDRTKGIIAWVIISLIAFTFAIWGIQSYLQSGSDQTALKINGTKISTGQVDQLYQRLRNRLQQQLGDAAVLDQQVTQRLKQQATHQLIAITLQHEISRKAGFVITDAQLANAIRQLPAFQNEGEFSLQRYQDALARAGYDRASFERDLQKDLLISQLRAGIVASSFVLPNSVQQLIQLLNQTRDVGYVIIPQQQFVNKADISDEQIRQYYQQHQEEFISPEKVAIDYVTLSLQDFINKQNITTQQIQEYYQTNPEHFKIPARSQVATILIATPTKANADQIKAAQQKAQEILTQLKAGASFTELAKTKSDDPISGAQGGILPWLEPGSLDPQFEQAAQSLDKVGELSPVIRTQYGFNIIKLINKQPQKTVPFAQVKDRIAQTLKQQAARKQFQDASEEFANLAFTNPNSLQPLVERLAVTPASTELFTKQGANDHPLLKNSKIIAAAFNKEVLAGNNSEPIEISPGELVVLRIKQHQPAGAKPLATVQTEIKQQLASQYAQQQAQQLGKKILFALRSQKNTALSELAHQYDLTYVSKVKLGRNTQNVAPAIIQAAFEVAKPQPDNVKALRGVNLANGDYAVLEVFKVIPGTSEADNKTAQQQADDLQRRLADQQGQIAYQLYLDDAVKQAKIKYY